MSVVTWHYLAFDELTPAALYSVLQLRSDVFVVEQACIFREIDGADADAMHVLGMRKGRLVAYARCFAAGFLYPQASLGRVLTHSSVRGTGVGHALVREALARMAQQWAPPVIRIGAQAHLEAFYRQHGFVKTGPPYLEDGIPHLDMLRFTARWKPYSSWIAISCLFLFVNLAALYEKFFSVIRAGVALGKALRLTERPFMKRLSICTKGKEW